MDTCNCKWKCKEWGIKYSEEWKKQTNIPTIFYILWREQIHHYGRVPLNISCQSFTARYEDGGDESNDHAAAAAAAAAVVVDDDDDDDDDDVDGGGGGGGFNGSGACSVL